MTIRWEQRVGAALIAQRNAGPRLRVSGGVLLAQSRFGRWMRRARVALLVTVVLTVALVAAAAAAAIDVLIRIL